MVGYAEMSAAIDSLNIGDRIVWAYAKRESISTAIVRCVRISPNPRLSSNITVSRDRGVSLLHSAAIALLP